MFRQLQYLMAGRPVYSTLSQSIIFSELRSTATVVFSFLLATGYLKAQPHGFQNGHQEYLLSIPNKEVLTIYEQRILSWFKQNRSLDTILALLVDNQIPEFLHELRDYVLSTMFYFDMDGQQPERIYHAFLLGLFLLLKQQYRIRSNRESGLGRFDIALEPLDVQGRGFVLEIKRARLAHGTDLSQKAQDALAQIANKQYDAELRSLGVRQITHIAIAFDGKLLEGAFRVVDE